MDCKNMNLPEKPSHLPASCPAGPPSSKFLPYIQGAPCRAELAPRPVACPMRLGPVPSGPLCLCLATDRRLPAHAALCPDHAAAGPARHRDRGPAAQAGAAQAHGPVRFPLAGAVTLQACHASGLRSKGNVRGSLGSRLLTSLTISCRDPMHQFLLG